MGIQIIDDPNAGGLGAQLGRSLGKGLQEGLPKGIQQGALSAGLKNLEGKKLSPMGTLSALAGYGIDVSQAAQFLPYLQQQQANQDFMSGGRGAGGIPSSGIGSRKAASGSEPSVPESAGSEFVPLKGDPASIDESARSLMLAQPSRFLSVDSARQQAFQNYEQQQKLIANTESEFDKSLSTRLQKQGNDVYKDIIGDMKQDYARKAANAAASGEMTEQQAGDKFSRDLLDYAKMKNKLSKQSLSIPKLFRRNTKEILNGIREEYKKKAALETFANDLQAQQGMSAQAANVLAFPVSKELIDKMPKSTPANKMKSRDEMDKIFQNISNSITPDQSVISIAHEFVKRGFAKRDFAKRLGELHRENKVALTPLQERQLIEANQPTPMADIFNYSLWGLE